MIILLAFCSLVYAEDNKDQFIPFLNKDVTVSTDIHFSEKYCTECHLQIPKTDGNIFLRFKDYNVTCRCHGYSPESYTHPVGITPSADSKSKIPQKFPLEDGKITCNTCHFISMQCNGDQDLNKQNSRFLRVFSFKSRTALCFQCHESSQYERLNPHEQLDTDGNIIEKKCLYCHRFKPDEKHATLQLQRSGAPGTVEFVAEMSTLCFRCHFRKTKRHIINMNHLRKPSVKIRSKMKKSERKLKVILPLDDAGGITCPTCHNPHQRGVIPLQSPGARGASEKSRLRVPYAQNRICKACHNY